MSYIDDIIQFENESTAVDFKKVQYQKYKFIDLIKDIMAMANAKIKGDRHIIIGVLHNSNGSREICGINEEFIDSATYHQLIRENIEPEVHFDYYPHPFDGKTFGVFRIYDCDDRPYMMRKEFEKLRKGDIFIRKGSHQDRVTRADLDEIILSRSEKGFTSKISVGFDNNYSDVITFKSRTFPDLPSQKAAEKISSILVEREKHPVPKNSHTALMLQDLTPPPGRPYEQTNTEVLLEKLKKVKETYLKHDLYYVYEECSERLNFSLLNEGSEFVEDLLVTFRFPKIEGLSIFSKIFSEPQEVNYLLGKYPKPEITSNLYYPTVQLLPDYTEVNADIGKLRHGVRSQAFREDLRVVFAESIRGKEIKVECILSGRQLRTPRPMVLTIKVE